MMSMRLLSVLVLIAFVASCAPTEPVPQPQPRPEPVVTTKPEPPKPETPKPEPPKPEPPKPEPPKPEPPTPEPPKPEPAKGPDFSKIEFQGNPVTRDSFSLAVVAVADFLGRKTDYATVACASGNAFSPAINPKERNPARWHIDGWLANEEVNAVAARLGLKVRTLPIPERPGQWNNAEAARKQRISAAAIVRDAFHKGEVVVAVAGWADNALWPLAGIITGAKPDGTITGACLNGKKDNPMRIVPSETHAFSTGGKPTDPLGADVAMLRTAIQRIRATGTYAKKPYALYGVDAMDAWIAQMGKVPFAPPARRPAAAINAARNNAARMASSARTAVTGLRRRKKTFPSDAQPHVAAAADRYATIVKLLAPALSGKKDERYAAFMGTLEKQQAHAKVLEQVKAELVAAADAMEKAVKGSRAP
jgi:hypothetical protein